MALMGLLVQIGAQAGRLEMAGIVNLAMKVSESQHETYHIASTKLYE